MTSKRNYGMKILALGLSLCLMLGGAIGLAEDAQSSVFDGVMENMANADSITIDAQFALRQNGEDMMTGDMLFQSAQDAMYASAAVTHMDGQLRDMECSMADGVQTIRIGDEFYTMPVDEMEDTDAEEAIPAESAEAPADSTAEEVPATEKTSADYLQTVIDQLFGSVTDNMTISDTGLALHLAGDDVPAILNLAVSMASSPITLDIPMDAIAPEADDAADEEAPSAIMHGTRSAVTPEDTAKPTMTLGRNVHIERVDLDIALENNTISGIQCSILLIGKDADGAVLETEFAAVVRILDVNATTPATVDLTGVEMAPLESGSRDMKWHDR